MAEYLYTISDSNYQSKIIIKVLRKEINDSSISNILQTITQDNNILTINFVGSLSTQSKNQLDTIINNHPNPSVLASLDQADNILSNPIVWNAYAKRNTIDVNSSSSSYKTYLSGSKLVITPGTYKVDYSIIWSHAHSSSDIDIVIEANNEKNEYLMEPVDSGGGGVLSLIGINTDSDQRYPLSGFLIVENVAENINFSVKYRTSNSGKKSSIYSAVLNFQRLTDG